MAAPTSSPRPAILFGVFELDLRAGELRKNGAKLKLEGQPLQILALLLEHPGELVTREELKRKLWPADTFVDFEHSINVAVKRLRQALDDSADTPRFIETLPRRGYRFIYPVNGAAVETPRPSPAPRRALLWAGLAATAVLGLLVGLNVAGLRHRVFGPKSHMPVASLAVLPFKNLTGDQQQEYFADGVTDVLTTELAQVEALLVPSVTSAMHYKNGNKPLPEIARELKVQAVVEGSVQLAGDRLLLNIQMVDATRDRHLWARSYETDRAHVPALLREVARDLLVKANVELPQGVQARLTTARVVNPEAQEAYLKALFYREAGRRQGRGKLEEYFKKAIELDPNYAEAYAGLARLYAHGGAFRAGGDLEARAKSREYSKKALELDPQNAEAYTALAYADLADWDFQGAEKNFVRAIELNPNYPSARIWYAQFLGAMHRFDEAFVQAERGRKLAPLQIATLAHAAVPYWQSGNIDEAERRFQEILDLDPDYWFGQHLLALAHLQRGRFQEAIAALKKSIALREANPSGPGSPYGEHRNLGVLAYAYARAGQREEALKIARDMERRQKAGEIRAEGALAIAYIGLGNHSRALDWLEYDYERHGAGFWMLNADPFYGPLRSHPRFQDLVRRVGLPPGEATVARARQPGPVAEQPK